MSVQKPLEKGLKEPLGGSDNTSEEKMSTQLDRIEFKIDQIMAAQAVRAQAKKVYAEDAESGVWDDLHRFTPKQHAALQMLLHGQGNAQIAKRMGVSQNTAKVHVRGIAKKLGVNKRGEIMARMARQYETIDDDAYRVLTGGLPKSWHVEFDDSVECPWRHLYEKIGVSDAD